MYSSYTPAAGTVRSTTEYAGQPSCSGCASRELHAPLRAEKAPDALERKTVALDGDHVQRARTVGLDGAPLAQVGRAEPRGGRAVGGGEASRELGGDATWLG